MNTLTLNQEQMMESAQKRLEKDMTESELNAMIFTPDQYEPPPEASEITNLTDSEPSLEDLKKIYLAEKHNSTLSVWRKGYILSKIKDRLDYGEFLPWIKDNFHLSVDTAQNYIKIFHNYPDTESLRFLTYKKALSLLKINKEQRQDFMYKRFVVVGDEEKIEKTIAEIPGEPTLTTRETDEIISDYLKPTFNDESGDTTVEIEGNDNTQSSNVTPANTDNKDTPPETSKSASAATGNTPALNVGIGTANALKTQSGEDAGNIDAENPVAKDDNAEEVGHAHCAYARHVNDFDDCINNVCTNLNKIFTVLEICQDKPDIHSSFNDKLISMFEKYLNILGYILYKRSDKSGDVDFKPQNINELEEIPDMVEIAG